MPQDLKTLIAPIDEGGRAKRTQAENKILDRILKDLSDPELDHADFRGLMRDYCELKKQDNIKEKNLVHLAIAEARLSGRSRLRAPQDSSLVRDSYLAPTSAGIPSRVSGQSSTAVAPPSTTGYPDESPTDPANSPFAIDNSEFSSDPDIDPEWSLAPWGRRRNGKPRTEKEYRTILYRTVRDVYGLDLRDPDDCRRPDPQPIPTHADSAQPNQPHAPPQIESNAHNPPPQLGQVDPLPGPSPPEQDDPVDVPDDPREERRTLPSFPVGPAPRHHPNGREVSPFCHPDAPFLPKPTSPWCSDEW